jgi:hypothetical protein
VDNVRRGLEAMSPTLTNLGVRFAEYARFLHILSTRPSLESLTMKLSSAPTDLWLMCDT